MTTSDLIAALEFEARRFENMAALTQGEECQNNAETIRAAMGVIASRGDSTSKGLQHIAKNLKSFTAVEKC